MKYTGQRLPGTLIDFAQHLDEFPAKTTGESYYTVVPFVLLFRQNGAAPRVEGRNCSREELQWVEGAFGGFDWIFDARNSSTRTADLPSPAPDHSFKAPLFDNRAATALVTSLASYRLVFVAPWTADEARAFGEQLHREFLPQIEEEVPKYLLHEVAEPPVSQDLSRSPAGITESQSTFKFLEPALGSVIHRLQEQTRQSETSREDVFREFGADPTFFATFLFRVDSGLDSRASDRPYRFVFSSSQRELLDAKLPSEQLDDVERQLAQLVSEDEQLREIVKPDAVKHVLREWRVSVENMTAFQVLERGYWSDRSFISYSCRSASSSTFVSSWRVWYSRSELFRDGEREAFIKWCRDEHRLPDSREAEPLMRYLRSAIEEGRFALESIFIIPLTAVGDEDREQPTGVVQIAAPTLSLERRIELLTLARFAAGEVLALVRADRQRYALSREQGGSVAHTLAHTMTKSASTPLHNTFARLQGGIKSKRISGLNAIEELAVEEGLLFARTLEMHFSGRSLFRDEKSGIIPKLLQTVSWQDVRHYCERFITVALSRHLWDLCHDAQYADFAERVWKRTLVAERFVNFTFDCAVSDVCGHTDAVSIHLSSLIDNALASFDFTKVAREWMSRSKPSASIAVEGRYDSTRRYFVLTVTNNGLIDPDETRVLQNLAELFSQIDAGRIDPFLTEIREQMDDRVFTTKSGGGQGWALLQLASYLRRLEVESTDSTRHGRLECNLPSRAKSELAFKLFFPVLRDEDETPRFAEPLA